ncbi:MAG: hypothetical protein IKS16_09615, partial [Lachnospiraceae bacterium]|nr:hypothetical protein [Lachnospiraceae bacterium]
MKRKKGRKLISKRMLLTVMVSLAMVLGLMPGMSLKAYADDTKAYATYDVTTDANKNKSVDELKALQVTFNGKPWYIISDNSTAVDAGTVTLLVAEELGEPVMFDESSNAYSSSTVRTTLDNMTASGGSFAEVESAINTVKVKGSDNDVAVDAKLYLMSVDEVKCVPVNVLAFSHTWYLRTPARSEYNPDWIGVEFVRTDGIIGGGTDVYYSRCCIRPALQLNLSSVTFSPESNTFT